MTGCNTAAASFETPAFRGLLRMTNGADCMNVGHAEERPRGRVSKHARTLRS
jgi:hypothetical protein